MVRVFRWIAVSIAVWSVVIVVFAQTPTPSTRYTPERWRLIRPGLEYGIYLPLDSTASVIVTRIDPDLFVFRTHYRPDDPLDGAGWAAEIPCAPVIVNGNFFNPDNSARGLVIADEKIVDDEAFKDFGGLMQVDETGAVRVRSTIHEPYEGESLLQAVQGFPVLIYDGDALYRGGGNDQPARRTVIGQDRAGRILLITVTDTGMYLDILAEYLARTDLRIEIAVNFDGGTSTLLKLDSPYGNLFMVQPANAIPAVVAIYARERGGVCAPDSLVCECAAIDV